MTIADLEPGGTRELVVNGASNYIIGSGGSSGYWYTAKLDSDLYQSWSSFSFEDEIFSLLVVDAGVQAPQVMLRVPGEIEVFDGETKEHLRSIPLPAVESSDFLVADVDGSPGLEILVCTPDDLFVFDFATGDLRAAKYGFGCYEIEVGQIDSDPELEIALGQGPLGGFILDGATLSVDWADLNGIGWWFRLLDADGDGFDEILTYSGYQVGLRLLDIPSGELLWERSDLAPQLLGVGDLSSTGTSIVVVSNQYDPEIRILDPASGSDLWSLDLPLDDYLALAIGNLDSDPATEIAFGTRTRFPNTGGDSLVVVDADSRLVEASTVDIVGISQGLSAADLSGNGRRELVTGLNAPQQEWSPLVFDLGTRRVAFSGTPQSWASGGVHGSALAQLDGDPQPEACYLDWHTCVRCYDSLDFELDGEACPPDPQYPIAFIADDLDSDGRSELLVGTVNGSIHAFGGEPLAPLWVSPTNPLVHSPPRVCLRVGQLDQDAPLEIAVAGYATQMGSAYVLDSGDGHVEAGPFDVDASCGEIVPAAAPSPDRYFVGTRSGDVAELDLTTGVLAPAIATYPDEIVSLRSGDMTRDGVGDLIAASSGRIYLYDGASGSTAWTSPFLDYGAGLEDSLYVGDVDADSVPDLTLWLGTGFTIFEAPLQPLFLDGFESGDTAQWSLTVP